MASETPAGDEPDDPVETATPPADDDDALDTSPSLTPGDVVVDREQAPADQSPAVVMSRPPVEAAQWDLDHIDGTLADDNPNYPPDARAVVVIYRQRFEDTEQYDAIPVPEEVREELVAGVNVSIAATADLCKFYVFPEPRLELTGERWPTNIEAADNDTDTDGDGGGDESDHPRETEGDVEATADEETPPGEDIDLDRLAAVLKEAGFTGVEQRGDHVAAQRMGETYRVDRTGAVLEGGALTDKLAGFVEERYGPDHDR